MYYNKINKKIYQFLKVTWLKVSYQKEFIVFLDRFEKGGCDVICI